MILDLKDISVNQGAVLPFKYELNLGDVSFCGDCPFPEPFKVNGEVANHAGVLELSAVASTNAHYKCSRCAREFTEHFEVPIFRVLAKEVTENSDDDTIEIAGNVLDADSVVREAVVLNTDMVHLCKPDCKGLCQSCGKDLNTGECNCKHDNVDPRLAALKQLLDNDDYQ